MKGFVEISINEQIAVCGGKDAEAARFLELLGYAIGSIVRAIKIMRQNKQRKEAQPSPSMLLI